MRLRLSGFGTLCLTEQVLGTLEQSQYILHRVMYVYQTFPDQYHPLPCVSGHCHTLYANNEAGSLVYKGLRSTMLPLRGQNIFSVPSDRCRMTHRCLRRSSNNVSEKSGLQPFSCMLVSVDGPDFYQTLPIASGQQFLVTRYAVRLTSLRELSWRLIGYNTGAGKTAVILMRVTRLQVRCDFWSPVATPYPLSRYRGLGRVFIVIIISLLLLILN
jgi:hypothetical protein